MEGITSGIAMSRDGQWVAARGPEQKEYLFPVNGGEPKLVPGLQPDELISGWAPDGHSVYVIERGQVPAQVFLLDIATGHRTLWRSLEPADSAGIDTIGRVLVSADGKAYVYSYVRTLSDLYLVQGLN
jgi:Tol biopolymer transport system component